MKLDASTLRLSATDLAGHLGCAHLTELDRLAALRRLKPPVWRDPMLDVLIERGRIVEIGRHDELLAQGGTYARLHQAQMEMAQEIGI